jgi:hypothetical protein
MERNAVNRLNCSVAPCTALQLQCDAMCCAGTQRVVNPRDQHERGVDVTSLFACTGQSTSLLKFTIHSFCSLSHDKSVASSKASSPLSAI